MAISVTGQAGASAGDAGGAATDPTVLIARMRAGDRAAAAEFIERYGSRMRRRIHGRLSQPMRRLFDSMEIMSTLARRLDQMIRMGQLHASTERQLWKLLGKIVDHAVVDKARIFRRLQGVEGEDAAFAQVVQRRLRWAEQREPDGAAVELEHAMHQLDDPIDRAILSAWIEDTPHAITAVWLGLSADTIRQRWCSIRARLRKAYEEEA